MHRPWLYLITGISGFQVVAQRLERHGRSREIRNAHVLARCGTMEIGEIGRILLGKPAWFALALIGIVLRVTAAYASCFVMLYSLRYDDFQNRKTVLV